MTGAAPQLCKQCGKPYDVQGQGDLATFMLQSNYCQCHKIKAQSQNVSATVKCPKCGLEKVQSQAGSITSYLFQDLRCACDAGANVGGISLSSRFFNLKKSAKSADYEGVEYESITPGTIIGGIYKITRLLGHGGMGEVYLAVHTGLAKKCALKLIPPEQVTEVGWQRFQQEARAVSALNHVNIVQVSDLGIHDGSLPFYAMEYIEGKSLADLLRLNGPMPEATALALFKQILDGVDHAHRAGVIHRDLKPANIMVQQTGADKYLVKILDFGLAKLVKQDRSKQGLTAVGEIFGSPFYMSPEQCLGQRIDNRSDIYALGCSLFECLTGRPPFTGNFPQAIMHSHEEADPPALTTASKHSEGKQKRFADDWEIVMAKLLRKNPVERYQTCAEFKADLERIERNEQVQPFYVSRNTTKNADQDDVPNNAKTRASGGQPRANILLVAATILGATTLCGTTAFAVLKFMPQPKANSQKSQAATSRAFARPAALDFDTLDQTAGGQLLKSSDLDAQFAFKSAFDIAPYSKIIIEGGRPVKTFNFPRDIQIGKIEGVTGTPSYDALDQVRFDPNLQLNFIPWANITKSPNYFRRFQKGDFERLSIQQVQDPNAMLQSFTHMQDYKTTPALSLVAAPLATYKNGIAKPRHLNEASLKILAGCNFSAIYCTPAYLTIDELAAMPWLNNLHGLHLQEFDDVNPVLAKMRGSKNLDGVLLACPINDTTVELLASFANLRSFACSRGITSINQLKMLSVLPKLRDLTIGQMAIDGETITALRALGGLKHVSICTTNPYAAKTMAQRLHAAIPDLQTDVSILSSLPSMLK